MLLKNAGIDGRYLMVGFSIGGLVARLYASRYPAEILGMVFVDHAFIDTGWQGCLQRTGRNLGGRIGQSASSHFQNTHFGNSKQFVAESSSRMVIIDQPEIVVRGFKRWSRKQETARALNDTKSRQCESYTEGSNRI